jgi:hypothetical protein
MKTQIQGQEQITEAQIKKIYALLNGKGLIGSEECNVLNFSKGRTKHVGELSREEARYLIVSLVNFDEREHAKECNDIFNRIWSVAWDMGMIYGAGEDNYNMNLAKLNMFCRKRGAVKKNLTDMNFAEWKKVLRQLETMYKKHLKGK